ncbi:MAG: S24 family peptidase [Bacteroidales bacterium]|nr:S24 family peptidase [Bacteroidales bacterium]MDY6075567.1 S24 family peptidase [Bacteroidales bacterium]
MRKIDRFIEYMKIKGLNDNKVTQECGLSQGLLGQARSGKSDLGAKTIDKILNKYQDLNKTWLITGDGMMLKGEEDNNNNPIAKQTSNPNEGIPLIPVEAMAGALTCDTTVLEYECDRYVVPVFKGADFLIPVKGSSMYPKYSSGDIVACQRVDMNNLFFQWNKVYVIDTNQGALIKRIKPGHDENHILIVSDNEKYDPFELPYSAIHAVALVIGVIRLE